jgi:hypothetical protein
MSSIRPRARNTETQRDVAEADIGIVEGRSRKRDRGHVHDRSYQVIDCEVTTDSGVTANVGPNRLGGLDHDEAAPHTVDGAECKLNGAAIRMVGKRSERR